MSTYAPVLQDVEHEIRIMKKMDHPNCVKLYEVCAQTNGNEGEKKSIEAFETNAHEGQKVMYAR
jgi:hypothetical protein